MKLLVSDYDGTLNPHHKNEKCLMGNIDAIKRLMANGDKFMLSTGREYYSIKKEIMKYNIPYDFLSCNDGSVLFDQNDNFISAEYIDVSSTLLDNLSNIGNIKLFGIKEEVKLPNDIIDIGVYPKSLSVKKYHLIIKSIIDEYNLLVFSLPGRHFVETKGGKSRSIKALETVYNFKDIITVGDSTNDLAMLKDYDGYRVLCSHPDLYFKGLKTTTDVKSLVKKMMN